MDRRNFRYLDIDDFRLIYILTSGHTSSFASTPGLHISSKTLKYWKESRKQQQIYSTTVEEVQLSCQTEQDRHHVSEEQKAQRRYD